MIKIKSSIIAIIMMFGLIPNGFAAVNEAVTKGSIGMTWPVTSSGVTADDACFKLSTENVCPDSGPYSLKMEHNNNVSGSIAIKIPVSLVVDARYRITFKSTVTMRNSTANQKIILGPSATGWASGCKMFSSSNNVTCIALDESEEDGWVQQSFPFTAKSADLYLSLQTDMNGKDRYFDDFELSLLDSNDNVVENLVIPNADFNFKDPAIQNISVDENVISWEEKETYDVVKVYEKATDGTYSKLAEITYPETSYTAAVLAEQKIYYLTTVTNGEETLEIPVAVVPDKQISEITLKNSGQSLLQSLETGTLSAEISIENNSVSDGIKAQLIAVLYKDEIVVESEATEPLTINPNGSLVEPTILSVPISISTLDDGEYRLEIFVWDSFKTMNTVKSSIIVNEPEAVADGE